MSPKSGADIGADNAARLSEYLLRLETGGVPLPIRAGKPNMSAIAIACGFDRQVLYKNPAAVALIGDFVRRHPADAADSAPAAEQPDAKPTADRRDNRIRQLEQQLAAARAEVAGLREQLKRFRHVEEHSVSTGRGVRSSISALPSLGEIGKP